MKKTRILIVEDENIVARDIGDRLQEQDYEVIDIVSTGEKAIEKTIKAMPDLVLMDIKLKGKMDGVEAAKQIHEKHDIPIVYLTAYADDDILQRAAITEPYGYILKPFQDRELDAVIKFAVAKHTADRKLKESEETLQEGLWQANKDIVALNEQLSQRVKQLSEAERLYQGTLDNMLEGCQIISFDWRYLYVNDAIARQGHQGKEQLIGHTMMEIYPGIENTEMFAELKRCMENRAPHFMENEFTFPDGSKGWFKLSIQPVPQGIFIMSADITERKQAEQAIMETEKKYHLLVKGIKDYAIFMLDPNGYVASWNEGAERIKGYKAEEIIGKHFSIFYPGDDIQQGKPEHGLQVAAEGGTFEYEGWRVRKDGSRFWANVIITAIRDDTGNLRGFSKVTRDITERKQAELHIKKLYSLQSAIREINQILLQLKDETELFQQTCSILCKVEFINAVWIGMITEGSFDIKPVAQVGCENVFLPSFKVAWDDSQYGNGPSGKAIKSKKPVVINDIASDSDSAIWAEDAMRRGVAARMSLPLIFEKEAIGILSIGSVVRNAFGDEEVEFLVEVAGDIAVGIRTMRLQKELAQSLETSRSILNNTVEAIGILCEQKDPYTAGHERRVARLAAAIAVEMKLSKDNVAGIELASFIHDIGKLVVPAEILNKPGKLTDHEFGIIRTHPEIAYKILKGLEFPWPVAQIIYQHHERMDGSGYPQGLRGEDITLEARILAVADVVEAMAAHRPYRPALGIDKALEEISKNKGVLYEPAVVDACITLFQEKRFKLE